MPSLAVPDGASTVGIFIIVIGSIVGAIIWGLVMLAKVLKDVVVAYRTHPDPDRVMLAKQVGELYGQIAQMTRQLELLSAEVSRCEDGKQGLHRELAAAHRRMDEQRGEIAETKAELAEARSELASANGRIAELEAVVSSKHPDLALEPNGSDIR